MLENLRLASLLASPGPPHLLLERDPLRSRALLTDLESRYGGRPVLVRGRRGPALLILSKRDALRVVSADDAYAPPAEPHAAGLTSDVLRPAFLEIAREEAGHLTSGVVDHPRLSARWERVARRCVYGDGAAADEELTRLLTAVTRAGRRRAHRRGRRSLRRREILSGRYDARLIDHLRRAEPGSLAGLIARAPDAESRGLMQAAFWLMGFGVAASALTHTLALLAAHPPHRKAARSDPDYLRACLHEGMRLWPAVPALARVTTADTSWYGTTLPAGRTVLIPVAAHQRNPRLPYANTFAPEIWLDGTAASEWWAQPPCAGVHLTVTIGTAFLSAILRDARPKPVGRVLSPHRPLPHSLNLSRLRVTMRPVLRRPVSG